MESSFMNMNTECIFDSDRVLTKPDFSKLDICKFEEYVTMCFLLFREASDKIVWEINRIDRSFRLRIFSLFNRDFIGECYSNGNEKIHENQFDAVNSYYGIVEQELIRLKIMNAPFSLDREDERWWARTGIHIGYIIQRMNNIVNSKKHDYSSFNIPLSEFRFRYFLKQIETMYSRLF